MTLKNPQKIELRKKGSFNIAIFIIDKNNIIMMNRSLYIEIFVLRNKYLNYFRYQEKISL